MYVETPTYLVATTVPKLDGAAYAGATHGSPLLGCAIAGIVEKQSAAGIPINRGFIALRLQREFETTS